MKQTLLLLVCLCCPLFASLGDVNRDGKITLDDCKLIAAAVANGTTAGLLPADADIDGDGNITILDAMRLHQTIGGLWIEPTGKIPANPQINESERAYLSRYEDLCSQFDAMSPSGFINNYPVWKSFTSSLDPKKCLYYDTIASTFNLTVDQISALQNKGFVILSGTAGDISTGFGSIFAKVYSKDLPVFFTTDALLDPLYRSYDNILKAVESAKLIPQMKSILDKTLSQLQAAKSVHTGEAGWSQQLLDVEVYLSVAKSLLNGTTTVSGDAATAASANDLLQKISNEALTTVDDFFGAKYFTMDFSQFKPRGHYTCQTGQATCDMSNYFKCMMWLGRADCAFQIDSLRQFKDFLLLYDCMDKAQALNDLADFNSVITFFVGDMDCFSAEGLTGYYTQSGSKPAIETVFANDSAAKQLRNILLLKGCGNQFILSQALWKDPDAPRPALPSIAQIAGQRFILDSYLLGHTVEWYVKNRNVPKLEEVAFCLGNNAGLREAQNDIMTFTNNTGDYKPLHCRLGAMRTLFDEYPYWSHNLYTIWLDALRELSKPLPDKTPNVMRSVNWQEKQMNSQLASWAQLRHNTLLYAKQSYTGGVMCFYPNGYVEPYPQFYRKVGSIMKAIGKNYGSLLGNQSGVFGAWDTVSEALASMAEKELAGEALTYAQIAFLSRMLAKQGGMCGIPPYAGWYPKLYYSSDPYGSLTSQWDACANAKPCIADVHTIPPSIISPSDMVLHAATGAAKTIVIMVSQNDSCGTIFAGPVSSFYQYNVSPIGRKTDEEWLTILQTEKPLQPTWIESFKK
jgi:hypothetical protein